MGELAQTPEAAREKFSVIALREVGNDSKTVSNKTIETILDRYSPAIVKEAQKREKARICQALGVQRLEDASQIAQLRAERDARVTLQEEAKHGKAAYWRGFTIGGMVCGAIVGTALALYAAAIINPAFDAAGRIRAQSDITDALVRSQQEPQAEPYVNPGQDVTRRP